MMGNIDSSVLFIKKINPPINTNNENPCIFQQYKVFKEVNALLILVPALLGLKGNLDMCLASRLSTQANLGNMKSKKELFKMVTGNLVLVQVTFSGPTQGAMPIRHGFRFKLS